MIEQPGVDLIHLYSGIASGMQYAFTTTQIVILMTLCFGLALFAGAIIVGAVVDWMLLGRKQE